MTAPLLAVSPAAAQFERQIPHEEGTDAIALAVTSTGEGYWLAETDGEVRTRGDAEVVCDPPNIERGYVTGIERTPSDGGYWLVTTYGEVFPCGDAQFHGEVTFPLAGPVKGIARTPDGGGYWLGAEDGGVFSFGNAQFYGSMAGANLAAPVVGITAGKDRAGYWLVATDGGVFTFGNLGFYGSAAGLDLAAPVTNMTSTPSGNGYYLVAEDGGVFSYGDAVFRGNIYTVGDNRSQPYPFIAIEYAWGGSGYYIADVAGNVLGLGDADVGGDDGLMPVGDPGFETVATADFPAGGMPALLTDVRVGSHEGFDRVVLEFRGEKTPSYRVRYVEPPIREDASGNQVDVQGEAFLEVKLAPASGVDLSGNQPQETYTGPRRIDPAATDVVTEVVRTGDFEGQLTWVIGLDQRAPFGVAMLEDPVRLVVDVVEQ